MSSRLIFSGYFHFLSDSYSCQKILYHNVYVLLFEDKPSEMFSFSPYHSNISEMSIMSSCPAKLQVDM